MLVAFSGGVDSAVAALLLRERGYETLGVTMAVRDASGFGCGDADAPARAERLAEAIGLRHRVVDCSGPYRELVLDHFRREYLAARTPNPCVVCNPRIKFGLLPRLAREQGMDFDLFATGHYARVEYSPAHGRHVLRRAADLSKDQSYFLYRLDRELLPSLLFPLGGFLKKDIRAMARERNLPVHDQPDSQDFYAGDYADLMERPPADGDIVDTAGKVLGRHRGYWNFTPGQRKGLGVAHTEPLYVLRIDAERNLVVAGTREEQLREGCAAGDLVFHLPAPKAGDSLLGRVRSSQPLGEMTIVESAPGRLAVRFAAPIHGVAPGQSLVLYDGDVVAGGGIIEEGFQRV